MTRKRMKTWIVLLREDWTGKIYNCPWIFPFTKEGYEKALKHRDILYKLFPEKKYNIKAYSFNKGAETEVQITFSVLTN